MLLVELGQLEIARVAQRLQQRAVESPVGRKEVHHARHGEEEGDALDGTKVTTAIWARWLPLGYYAGLASAI